jgi:HEPN domain-containing protein
MAEESLAELLLSAAKRDRQAFRALAAIPEMNDAAIGFHAHQCVEKSLKAILL